MLGQCTKINKYERNILKGPSSALIVSLSGCFYILSYEYREAEEINYTSSASFPRHHHSELLTMRVSSLRKPGVGLEI